MPPSTHHVENAKSGRSKCKRCKELIANGELRIEVCTSFLWTRSPQLIKNFLRYVSGAYSETQDMHFISNYHTTCFKVPPRAMAGVSPADFVDEHLEDKSNDRVLSDEATLQEIIDDIAICTNATKKSSKKKAKKRSKAENDDEEEYRPTKEAKKDTVVKSEEVSEEEASDVGEKDEVSTAATQLQEWVGCETCGKWRKLPDRILPDSLPDDEWFCNMNTWNVGLSQL